MDGTIGAVVGGTVVVPVDGGVVAPVDGTVVVPVDDTTDVPVDTTVDVPVPESDVPVDPTGASSGSFAAHPTRMHTSIAADKKMERISPIVLLNFFMICSFI